MKRSSPIILSDADIQRFWGHVDIRGPEECWYWKKGCQKPPTLPYGKFSSHETGKQLFYGAHRIAYFLTFGSIPEGLLVRHKVCDNPKCCNPRHLALGTDQDNMDDKHAAGRQRYLRGEQVSKKLKEVDVVQIIRRAALGETQAVLAAQYGVERNQIGRIVRGERWAHVDRSKILSELN